MFRHYSRCWLLTTAFTLFFPIHVFADTIQGRITNVKSTAMDLTVFDGAGRPYPNALRLKVDNFSRLNNFSSMNALRKNDLVRVDTKQGRDGQWHADTISRLESSSAVPAPVTRASPSLMDALKSPAGQNIIKRGITGAVVGGVASGASGGKAGKGALIGAGAGIVGGWLSDILNRPSQTQTSQTNVYYQDDSRN